MGVLGRDTLRYFGFFTDQYEADYQGPFISIERHLKLFNDCSHDPMIQDYVNDTVHSTTRSNPLHNVFSELGTHDDDDDDGEFLVH